MAHNDSMSSSQMSSDYECQTPPRGFSPQYDNFEYVDELIVRDALEHVQSESLQSLALDNVQNHHQADTEQVQHSLQHPFAHDASLPSSRMLDAFLMHIQEHYSSGGNEGPISSKEVLNRIKYFIRQTNATHCINSLGHLGFNFPAYFSTNLDTLPLTELANQAELLQSLVPVDVVDHKVREVWAYNLEQEMVNLSHVVQTHRYIALKTESPGIVAKPVGEFYSSREYRYHVMRCNVNLLKVIQISFTFFDEHGNQATPISTWTFNFQFDLGNDMYAQESIDLLKQSGIQFDKHQEYGIDPFDFAAELYGTGVVLQKNTAFLSYHSGFDFGYLLKCLFNEDIEDEDEDFYDKLKAYCPNVYDVKYLIKTCTDLRGGLQEVAYNLGIQEADGQLPTPGSASVLTGKTFFKIKEKYLENYIEREKYSHCLYDMGPPFSTSYNQREQ